jgi:hypothetical protein
MTFDRAAMHKCSSDHIHGHIQLRET